MSGAERGKKAELPRWEPDRERHKDQFDLVHRIMELCGMAQNWRAIVWFGRRSDPSSRGGLIPIRDFLACTVNPENNGNWQQVLTVGAHIANSHVLVGGGAFDPIDPLVEKADDRAENGIRGWWVSRLGRAYLRDVMPDNYVSDAVPEGHLRDVRAHPRQYMSLFYTDKETHRENAAVRARLPLILSEAEQLHSDELQLRAPSFFVVAGAKPIVIRGLHINRTDKDEETLDELTADNIELGSWIIPELKHVITPRAMMNTGDLCIVKRVSPDDVELVGDGHVITMKNPANIIREFIKKRTGRDAADLDIVPIVELGQQVGHDSCIFGPVRPHLIGANSLRPKGDDAETRRAKRRADLMGVWSVLAEGHEYGKQVIYPIKYVAPRKASRVYASLVDESGEDAGTQLIRLSGAGKLDASAALKRVEPGVRINLRNTSIRAWQRHEQRLRREREHRDNKE